MHGGARRDSGRPQGQGRSRRRLQTQPSPELDHLPETEIRMQQRIERVLDGRPRDNTAPGITALGGAGTSAQPKNRSLNLARLYAAICCAAPFIVSARVVYTAIHASLTSGVKSGPSPLSSAHISASATRS